MPCLVSIQVAQPRVWGREHAPQEHDRPWRTGFFKEPVLGAVGVETTHLHGDGQADLENHGGIDKAALAYSADHYPRWRAELVDFSLPESGEETPAHVSPLARLLAGPPFPYGSFGENLSISGLSEQDVCIGDEWQMGNALFQVSQPRQPCWKLSRRWRINDLSRQVIRNGRTGWYFRVLQTGEIIAGQDVVLRNRPLPTWTIARANELLYHRQDDLAAAEELANQPLLSLAWREMFLERLVKRRG